jgi:DNA-binding protein HU-beta
MTKAELVAKIATKCKLNKAQSERAVNGFVDVVKEAIKKGDKLRLVGFGTFSVTKRKARTGRNPQTGKPMKIAAKKVPKFSASPAFRKIVK